MLKDTLIEINIKELGIDKLLYHFYKCMKSICKDNINFSESEGLLLKDRDVYIFTRYFIFKINNILAISYDKEVWIPYSYYINHMYRKKNYIIRYDELGGFVLSKEENIYKIADSVKNILLKIFPSEDGYKTTLTNLVGYDFYHNPTELVFYTEELDKYIAIEKLYYETIVSYINKHIRNYIEHYHYKHLLIIKNDLCYAVIITKNKSSEKILEDYKFYNNLEE